MLIKLTTIIVMSVAVASCAHQMPEVASSINNSISIESEHEKAQHNLRGQQETTIKTNSNLWQRIRDHFVLTDIQHPRIHRHLKKFKKNRQINVMAEKAQPLLPYLLDLAKHRELPAELVLIPMIESGFKPDAVSPGNAAGLWQFRPATAKNFGLTVNSRYDERYDIHESTMAALDYLEYLYDFFEGDWLLAIAAYNCGEGTVQKAIRAKQKAQKNTDYWALDNLPKITRNYVPKILALAQMIAHPHKYDVNLPPVDNQPYLLALDIDSSVNPRELVNTSSINQEIAFYFNPALKTDRIPNGSYKLLLPRQQAILLNNTLNHQSNPVRLVQWSKQSQKDTAKPSSQSNFRRSKVSYSSTKSKSEQAEDQLVDQIVYSVNSGDTLESIARLYGVPANMLAQWNRLDANSPLKKGQKIIIKLLHNTKQAMLEYHRQRFDIIAYS